MDLYTFLLFLGAAGLAAMALQGIGAGHGGGHGHGHGHGGGHAGHGSHGHAGHGGHVSQGAQAGHAAHGHGSSAGHGASHGFHVGSALMHFASPRVLFSVCIGMGAFAPMLRPVMGGGALLFAAALGVGILFELVVASPIWNLVFRFTSKPAMMLESVVDDEGTAVTSFDRNGQGLIAVDLDGQVVQLLATLSSDDRAMGAAVRAGDRLRIADVDTARNRCTVAVI